MGFFSNWKSSSGNDEGFMVDFLNKSAESVLEIENGDEDEINNACEVLSQINVNKMIEILLTLDTQRNVLPAEIPQYSSFLDGVCKLPELIEDETNGVGFEKIGLLLAGSAKKGACVKYGENHSKLASIFGLVSISTTKPKMVKITRLGKKLINYSLEQKKTILQMLLLREYIVKK